MAKDDSTRDGIKMQIKLACDDELPDVVLKLSTEDCFDLACDLVSRLHAKVDDEIITYSDTRSARAGSATWTRLADLGSALCMFLFFLFGLPRKAGRLRSKHATGATCCSTTH